MEKKYIIAVSGGPDSMALLDMYKNKIVGACLVNYHKRDDCDFDMTIVYNYCKQHKIPLMVRFVNKTEYVGAINHNFQSLARKIRYDFFVQCSKKFKCKNLLVAHNLNDFLETAKMQENRKSLNFFYGIKQVSKYEDLTIYRPLIKVFKKDLEKYCIDSNIPYAIDSSNSSDIYERNRIRKQLNKLSETRLTSLFNKIMKRNKKFEKKQKETENNLSNWNKSRYSVKYFSQLKKVEQNNLIYMYLKQNNISNINYNKINLIRDFIVSNKSNCSLRLESNIQLHKQNKVIKIIRR